MGSCLEGSGGIAGDCREGNEGGCAKREVLLKLELVRVASDAEEAEMEGAARVGIDDGPAGRSLLAEMKGSCAGDVAAGEGAPKKSWRKREGEEKSWAGGSDGNVKFWSGGSWVLTVS